MRRKEEERRTAVKGKLRGQQLPLIGWKYDPQYQEEESKEDGE